MLNLRPATRCCSENITRNALPITWTRNASLTSSISAGVRKAAKALENAEKRRIRQGTLAPWEQRDQEKVAESRRQVEKHQQNELEREERLKFFRSSTGDVPIEGNYERMKQRDRMRAREKATAKGCLVDVPTAVP